MRPHQHQRRQPPGFKFVGRNIAPHDGKRRGIYREEQALGTAGAKIAELRRRNAGLSITDHSKVFNTELLQVLELGALLENRAVRRAYRLIEVSASPRPKCRRPNLTSDTFP